MDWRLKAACRDNPGPFFADPYERMPSGKIIHAKRICACCDVQKQCLQYAIVHKVRYGIWGGKTPEERGYH